MIADGTWKFTAHTAAGPQEGTLTLKTAGAVVTGIQRSSLGPVEIQNGQVSGNRLTWSLDVTQPFTAHLQVAVVIDGDGLTGEIDAGSYGKAKLTGTRTL